MYHGKSTSVSKSYDLAAEGVVSGEEEAGDQHDQQQQEERDSRFQEQVLNIVWLVRIGHNQD